MMQWLKELDDVLRGRKADRELLAAGTGHIQIQPLVGIAVIFGVVYGLFMGMYAVFTRDPACFAQMFASAVKVPLLFLLTLVVTFPSLYVFSSLLGVRLNPKDTLRLILVPIAINLTVLASLGPITAFFTLSTTSYHFMKLLNVFFFTVSGVIGLAILMTMLSRLEEAQAPLGEAVPEPPAPPPAPAAEGRQGPLSLPPAAPRKKAGPARQIFQIWLFIYALVGAQMGWVLRPFVGSPDLPFQWFRAREANIFVDVLRTIGKLLGA